MRAEWEELLSRAPAANIFLTFDWLATWWRHYGQAARLWILCAYEDGVLVGLAPLMIQERRLAGFLVYRRVAFLGTGISDRLDLLLTPGSERAVLTAIVTELRGRRWDVVDLQEIPESSITAKVFPEVAESLGARVEVTEQSVCPVVRLASDADAHLATLGHKLRRNIRHFGRKLRSEHAVRLDFIDGGPRLEEDLDAFLRMYRKCFAGRPNTREFTGNKFAAFRREVAIRLAMDHRLLLQFLRLLLDQRCGQRGGQRRWLMGDGHGPQRTLW